MFNSKIWLYSRGLLRAERPNSFLQTCEPKASTLKSNGFLCRLFNQEQEMDPHK
jgi:hypothetical protein